MTTSQPTLTELVQKSGAALRVYDLGRRLSRLSADQFKRVEECQTPYPTPYLHHAWIALTLWNPSKPDQNAVWFLKLPLDEQGFMIPAVRDDLLERLLKNVHASENGVPQEDSLKDNPFYFKPAPEKMAIFHAQASRDSGAAPSIHFEAIEQIVSQAGCDTERWRDLPVQALADYVIRLDDSRLQTNLSSQIEQLPEGLAAQLLSMLEHIQPGPYLTQALVRMIGSELTRQNTDPVKLAALVRAISQSTERALAHQALLDILSHAAASREIELLSAIATRCENLLMDSQLLIPFLECLASSNAGQQGFSRVLAELMYLPVHRVLIVQSLRGRSNSEALNRATDEMFGVQFREAN